MAQILAWLYQLYQPEEAAADANYIIRSVDRAGLALTSCQHIALMTFVCKGSPLFVRASGVILCILRLRHIAQEAVVCLGSLENLGRLWLSSTAFVAFEDACQQYTKYVWHCVSGLSVPSSLSSCKMLVASKTFAAVSALHASDLIKGAIATIANPMPRAM